MKTEAIKWIEHEWKSNNAFIFNGERLPLRHAMRGGEKSFMNQNGGFIYTDGYVERIADDVKTSWALEFKG